ncbi:hypothetical protein [Bradyrhizobium embrapense]|uniref:hypothetical protein n=1 Tax=Bradyrhizobium embrapense TaxID=630921 RepID=UPI0007C58444|nr:hypothetical protein [Bradyrhizobium embrapense]
MPRAQHAGPKKDFDADFFYGSGSNYLWLYLEKATGEQVFANPGSPEAAAEPTEYLMHDFLRRHRIWMRDVLQTYKRKKGHEASSSDEHIDINNRETTFLNFPAVLEAAPNLSRVVFTSVRAADWFFNRALAVGAASDGSQNYRQMFVAANSARSERSGRRQVEQFCEAEFNGMVIGFYVAPSPSGSARHGLNTGQCVEIYRSIIFDNR